MKIIEQGYRPKRKAGQKPVNQTKPPQAGSGVWRPDKIQQELIKNPSKFVFRLFRLRKMGCMEWVKIVIPGIR